MAIRERILEAYSQFIRAHGKPPDSVFGFVGELQISEKDFFREFASFAAVEDAFWAQTLDNVIQAVRSGAEFAGFTARQQFLTFGFAFLEHGLDIRSIMLCRLGNLSPTCRPPFLLTFESSFKEFAKQVLARGKETGEVAERGRLGDLYPGGLYLVFRSLIEFNLKDQSPRFERSDAFWEKTVNLSFDLVRTQALDSAFDLARFLLPVH